MFSTFKRMFSSEKSVPTAPIPASAVKSRPLPQETSSGTSTCSDDDPSVLSLEAADFLLALMSGELAYDINKFSMSERSFLTSSVRKLKQNEYDIPMLPDAALSIRKILSDPNAQANDFIDIIQSDPTLSAELLKLANSSYLGFTYPTLDLKQAVTRVGFSQLTGLVTMLSMRSRILKNNVFQHEIAWVMDLSMAMARLCQQLAPELETAPEEAFTLGLLHHVEYLVVLGEASQFLSMNQGSTISRQALIENISRIGPALHTLISNSWGLGGASQVRLVVDAEGTKKLEVSDLQGRRQLLDTLQQLLIETWRHNNPLYDPTETRPCDSMKTVSFEDTGFRVASVKKAIEKAISI
ncbi:MAG: HDOD domain-containing protein [Desulfuromonadales bacterium]|nr:HDOD domain-containing protein [Desulfuromonadales bacterium]